MRAVYGSICFNSSTHLPPCVELSVVKPVILPVMPLGSKRSQKSLLICNPMILGQTAPVIRALARHGAVLASAPPIPASTVLSFRARTKLRMARQ
jgi:hypothetical protein